MNEVFFRLKSISKLSVFVLLYRIFIHRMITKTQLEEQLKSLPEEFSIEDLIERLILLEKIETGVKESENNQVISEMALEEEIKKWFK